MRVGARPGAGRKPRGRPPEDLSGKTFANWTVLGRADGAPTRWACRCVCGNTRSLRTPRLKESESCGCVARARGSRKSRPAQVARPLNLVGLVFGRLRVIERGDRPDNGGPRRWRCLCSCGAIKDVRASSLWRGNAQSCGCLAKEKSKAWQRQKRGEDTPEKTMLRAAKGRARKHGFEFGISEKDIAIPRVCPVLGIEMDRRTPDHAPSLDRVDTLRGYVPGNVMVISARANRIKSDGLPHELAAIAAYAARINENNI